MILTECVAIGLLLSLYLSEILGYVAGGLVVPGYFVVISSKPLMVVATIAASLLSLGVLKLCSRYALIYGRRRLFLSVLLGFIFSELSRLLFFAVPSEFLLELQAFGFIIPGLLAYWMDKQGMFPALGMLGVVVTIVRLIVIIIHQGTPVI
ncbi:MAG: poly-gamma-glutamate biosynthesis protein PgsC [Chitinivibrionales bacterium]|nr:poly-gamma-glutamate biosynthesis protein PgsC [Chitinivibrionales bacterium]